MSTRRRSAALAAALALGAPAPAAAVMDEPNPLGCAASASVQAGRAKSQFVDSGDGEIRLPRRGDVYWTGSVARPARQDTGAVRMRVGFWSVTLGSWGPSADPTGQVVRQGATVVPAFVRYLPPGRYVVEGRHQAAEGRCSGAVTVVLAGSTATTLAAAGGALLAVPLALGLVRSGRRRPGRARAARAARAARGRPIRGAFMGAFLGVALDAVLLTAYLVPSDSLLIGAMPLVLLVAGVVLGAVAPFGRPQE